MARTPASSDKMRPMSNPNSSSTVVQASLTIWWETMPTSLAALPASLVAGHESPRSMRPEPGCWSSLWRARCQLGIPDADPQTQILRWRRPDGIPGPSARILWEVNCDVSSDSDPLARLDALPRLPLLPSVTPFYRLDGMSERHHFEVYIKRDDLTGVGAGGNKARKLEYLLADAKAKGHQSVVSGGGVQSNHAAMTAVCSKRVGMDCYLALVESVPVSSVFYDEGANVSLDRLCGASITRFKSEKPTDAYIIDLVASLARSRGEQPYLIPVGGSSAIGALGYVRAALEFAQQEQSAGPIDTIVVACGSAGTQAGLLVGLAMAGLSTKVIGISVSHTDLRDTIIRLCQELAGLLGLKATDWADRVVLDHRFVGEGYGLPSSQTWESIQSLIGSDAVICDPVYTGKALTGLLDYLEGDRGILGAGVTFWHTGGITGLFGYSDRIQAAVDMRVS